LAAAPEFKTAVAQGRQIGKRVRSEELLNEPELRTQRETPNVKALLDAPDLRVSNDRISGLIAAVHESSYGKMR